jgi:UDP:flavonoid glycosyltransferase YjiC (YdhE family)
MEKIIEITTMVDRTQIGFVISLQKYSETYAKIDALGLPNVFLSSWVPQKKVLGHPNTKLFFTHCGGNGVIEANYFGVAMLGFPQMWEQLSVGYRIE